MSFQYLVPYFENLFKKLGLSFERISLVSVLSLKVWFEFGAFKNVMKVEISSSETITIQSGQTKYTTPILMGVTAPPSLVSYYPREINQSPGNQ